MTKVLTEFVLVRLEPLKWEADREFGEEFGVTKYPVILLLDPAGEKVLGRVGDETPEKVAAALRSALTR